jgi:hypothetical protein
MKLPRWATRCPFLGAWTGKDAQITWKLYLVPRAVLDSPIGLPDAHHLVGLDSGNVRRYDVLLDTAFGRRIDDPNEGVAAAMKAAPEWAAEILRKYL